MKKLLKIVLISVIFGLAFIQYSLAADVATLKVSPKADALKIGDKIEFEISIMNNSIADGITEFYGIIDFNSDIFEEIKLDYDEASEGVNTITKTIIDNFKTEKYDLLYVSDEWCIAGVEQDEKYGFAAFTITKPVEISSSYTKIGTITLKVLESTENGSTEISLTNLALKDETEIADATSSTVTISSNGDYEDIEEITDSRGEIDELEDSGETDELDEAEETNKLDEAEEEAPYTGVEDLVPFIIIFALIGTIGYIRYIKYKEI